MTRRIPRLQVALLLSLKVVEELAVWKALAFHLAVTVVNHIPHHQQG